MRVNLKNLVLCSSFIAGASGLVACGGSSNKNDDLSVKQDLTVTGDGPGYDLTVIGDASGNDLTTGPTTSVPPSQTTFTSPGTVTITGQTISPETAWAGGLPFINEKMTWYNDTGAPTDTSTGTGATGGAWTLLADANSVVRPYIAADATWLPSVSDLLTVGTAGQTNIPAHMWLKASNQTGTNNNAVTTQLTTVGGPTQSDLLAQGACIFEALAMHTTAPVPDYASAAVVESGFDVYTLAGDGAGNVKPIKGGAGISKTADPAGAGSGRFLFTKNGNTVAQEIHLTITDQSGSGFKWNANEPCDIIPGTIVFRPVVHEN